MKVQYFRGTLESSLTTIPASMAINALISYMNPVGQPSSAKIYPSGPSSLIKNLLLVVSSCKIPHRSIGDVYVQIDTHTDTHFSEVIYS